MLPTRNQIERAAYDRWLRRHRAHGRDRDDWVGAENELMFVLNYRAIVEYALDSSHLMILGDDAERRCRFCERTGRHTAFSAPRPVVLGAATTSLQSAQVCDECQADCRDTLAIPCENLWKSLDEDVVALPSLPRFPDSMAVFKSLVASALIIMPEHESGLFRRHPRMGE